MVLEVSQKEDSKRLFYLTAFGAAFRTIESIENYFQYSTLLLHLHIIQGKTKLSLPKNIYHEALYLNIFFSNRHVFNR